MALKFLRLTFIPLFVAVDAIAVMMVRKGLVTLIQQQLPGA